MLVCLKCKERYADAPGNTCPACGNVQEVRQGVTMFAPELAAESDGFADHLFDSRAEATETNFWYTSRDRMILWAMDRADLTPAKILEIGAGSGHVLRNLIRHYPDADITGAEISAKGLETAQRRCGTAAKYVQLDATALPYEAEFDAIGAFDVLEHIEADEAVLDQVKQALVPGGVFVATVPQHRSLWSYKDELFCHKRRYTTSELQRKIRAAGLDIVTTTSFVTLLLPALWYEVRFRRDRKTYNAERELKMNPLLNAALGAVMAAEALFIKVGIRLPIGGSRLVVARKPS